MVAYVRSNARRGFTLIEILIVLVVIGILSGTMMLNMGSGSDSARATRVVSDMKTLSRAAQMAYADGMALATDVTALSPYISGTLDCDGRFSLQEEGGYLYVRADLTDYGVGVRSRLGQGAARWNLWQAIDGDSPGTYADADSVFLPVNLSATDESETEYDFAYYFDEVEERAPLPPGWYVEDGVLKDSGYGYYYFGDNSWTDYAVSSVVTLGRNGGSLNSGYGMNFRTIYGDGTAVQGYRVQFDPDLDGIVVRTVGDQYVRGTDGKRVYVSFTDAGIDPEGSHELKVVARGSSYAISVDGKEVLAFDDGGRYASGGTGLRTWTNGRQDDFVPTEFDSIEVELLD